MTASDYLKLIVGGRVVKSAVGHGTFLDVWVRLDDPDETEVHLWVYLAAWVISEAEDERLATDMPDKQFDANAGCAALLEGKTVEEVVFRKDAEVQIRLSDDYGLEIWPNRKRWGSDAELILIYLNGKHVADFVKPPHQPAQSGPDPMPS